MTALLDSAGEAIHPASRLLVNESGHIESEAGEHDLHVFQALRRMDEILVANFMLFQEIVEDGAYDLVIADECWEVDHFWHEHPGLKRSALAWFTDFVGYMPMPEGGDREAYLTADYNAEMIEHIARHPRIRDKSIFVGNPDDIVAGTFGPGLPEIRAWTEQHFDFCGYITGLTRPRLRIGPRCDRASAMAKTRRSASSPSVAPASARRFATDRRYLSARSADSCPSLRMIMVAGPRIDTEQLAI